MPLYECIYYINPTATLPQTALTMKKLSEVVFKHNGVVRSLSNQGIIPLAYPMKRHQRRQTKARLVVMLFDCSSRGFLDFRKELEREEFVFRWLIQKQKNEFRPKDDSLYYHKGFEANDAVFEKLEDVRAEEYNRLSDQILLQQPGKKAGVVKKAERSKKLDVL
mmetsp:Transcript_9853/g.36746  ORF Transcript_9853/g.36746 Transcript_9853/m.36746 type:complete len:164 (-) Transcript_9853:190-681(-)|eukprot:CAMPEP_0117446962 /NCGR_PEP_ID=MMETSP0759-20121206/6622_1 /TAXON_ID=63605 /ORGANISM="Percolomonas cosmopolitus, Strain WS" /LENGTH=163 /DNA_ID=CAMNT_0005239267 /DNA_START=165 /DNA_END=656 /DNA_ORIENTATION=+